MIRITRSISIDESELDERFIRASGPGGQHVNKVATAVQLRFDAAGSPAINADMLKRLTRLSGSRMTESGEILIEASRHRTREQNRKDARERLIKLLREAATPPKPRRKTKPSKASKRRRLEKKRERSEKKERRRSVRRDLD